MVMTRAQILSAIDADPEVDVLIIGAGINGVGAFRDLALNGVRVLLVDRGDFCSGASAASSHMAHGGIRYLENGEFRLVQEAVRERNAMIANAPHIVRPLPTTIPIFKMFSGLLNAPLKFLGLLDRPSERGAFIIKLGLILYDAYTGRQRVVPRHKMQGRTASLLKWTKLNPAVAYTATYYDGLILQPERLGLELALDAEADGDDAYAINYCTVTGATAAGVLLRDDETGALHPVRPKVVINAAGPWIDLANGALGGSTNFIGGTKGSHLVLDHPELRQQIGDHEFFFENKDGRIVLILPLYDRVLIGTSDITIKDPDSAVCTEEEVDYFLGMIARVFPDIKVERSHVVYRFSGVRPLAASSARSTAQITRDHEIKISPAGQHGFPVPVLSLVGGKWTSFRAFGEQVTDRVLAMLGKTRRASTSQLAIGGGASFPVADAARKRFLAQLASENGILDSRAETLFVRYGTRAAQVAAFISAGADRPMNSIPDYSVREIGFIVSSEKLVHLEDFFLRRSMLAMLGKVKRPVVDEVAGAIADFAGWDAPRRAREIRSFVELMQTQHGVAL